LIVRIGFSQTCKIVGDNQGAPRRHTPENKTAVLPGKATAITQPNRAATQGIETDGSFKITEISPSRYHVKLTGLQDNFYVKSFRLGDHEPADGILDLRAGAANAELTVQLGTNAAEISGVVRGPKGTVSKAGVGLFFDDEYGFDLVESQQTDADGTYSFHGVAPGKYRIFAYDLRNAPYGWLADAIALYQNVTETIEAGEGSNVVQDLKYLAVQ
jgi:hypothetical protein